MKIIFITTNSLITLAGLLFFEWNPFGLLLIYMFESFFLTILTLYTLKKQGGNLLLNKYLPIDKKFYNKTLLTKNTTNNPFFSFSFMLIAYNFLIIILISQIIDFNNLKSILPLFMSFIGIAINYLNRNKKSLPLNNEVKLTNYLAQPVKEIFIMYFGLAIGFPAYKTIPFPAIIIMGIIALRLFMDLIIIKHNSLDFNKRILSLYGIKMLGIK